jgi:hypothetical protein
MPLKIVHEKRHGRRGRPMVFDKNSKKQAESFSGLQGHDLAHATLRVDLAGWV